MARRWWRGRRGIAVALTAVAAVGVAARMLDATPTPPRSDRPVWGFLTPWDETSILSFTAHASQMSVVVPASLNLTSRGTVAGTVGPDLVTFAHAQGVKVDPLITNDVGGWDAARVHRAIGTRAAATRLATTLSRRAARDGWDGINVDFEQIAARDGANLTRFVALLKSSLGPGRTVSIDVPASPSAAYRLPALRRSAAIIVMAYDQNATAGSVGTIASPRWIAARMDQARQAGGPGVVAGLPTYGYVWRHGAAPRAVDGTAALRLASRFHTLPVWSPSGGEPHFRAAGRTVWFADAVSVARDVAALPPGAPVALWHLGGEDAGLWPVLTGHATAARLTPVAPSPAVAVRGVGDVVRAVPSDTGVRRVSADLSSETYSSLPAPWTLVRRSGGDRRVALSFDDGPSAQWTPRIMAELKGLHVPATFFVIGQNAASNPDVLRQEVANGFTVGDHTFTHPYLPDVSNLRARIEIAATARTVAGITGHRPTLFRAPYSAGTLPTVPAPIAPLTVAQGLGQTAVGASVDSQDYLRPGVERIVHNVMSSLNQGDIILFHDGGGNRAQTVAALPAVVHALRHAHYRIVSVPQLAGVSPAAAMPAVTGGQLWLSRAVAWTAVTWFVGVRWVAMFGIGLIALLLARAVALTALAWRDRRSPETPPAGPTPWVTVLVPAYNEVDVIGATLDSLQAQVGVDAEIIVIDDGSRDGTAEAATRPGVRVITQANAGKWAALNRGVMNARGDVVVAVDADTILDPDAVRLLARWFADPAIGAVSGTAKVGNRRTLTTLWQHVEYVTSFNLDRRAYARLNAITVVPGALGAWRRQAVIDVGGYSGRTLAEDAELTISLRRAGWRIAYEPGAVAWTEAPESLRALARQRLRWTYGTLQVLWLNRGAVFRPREGALGSVALPFAWLYQIVLSPLAPLIDVIVLVAALTGGFTLALEWFAVATCAEMALAALAFRWEGERVWPVLTLPLQRVVHRQVMYWTVLRSLWRAARGGRFGWGKLARTGTVQACRPAGPSTHH